MAGDPHKQPSSRNWPKDWFGWCEAQQCGCLVYPLLFMGVVAVLDGFLNFRRDRATVIAYICQDQVYAEPILAAFSQETGVRVRSVFDSEAVKTVAIANRLLAERDHPQCDLYWGNEELRTRQLAAQRVFPETNAWTTVGYRSRRIVINTNSLPLAMAPQSWLELTNTAWRRRVALASPLFGTTATHFMAWRQAWGDAAWQNWCRALRGNQPFVVDGNSVVVQFVSRGEAWIGLTDSDDIAAARREGAPVAALPLTPESLLIPNTVAIVRGAPHPEPARRLYEYLQRPAVLQQLIRAQALEGAAPAEVPSPTLRPDWPGLLEKITPATEILQRIFLR